MREIGIGIQRLQHNIVDLFPGIPPDPDRWSLHGGWMCTRACTHTHTQQIDQYQWYQSADKKVNKKVDKNSYEDILIYYIGYESSDGLKPLHIIFYKINWYIEDNNGPKYLKLIPVDENKGTIKIDKKYGIKQSILSSQKIVWAGALSQCIINY